MQRKWGAKGLRDVLSGAETMGKEDNPKEHDPFEVDEVELVDITELKTKGEKDLP